MVLLVAALASAVALAACSNNNRGGPQAPAGNETAQNGNNGAANNGASDTMPAPEEDKLIQATGKYVGQIDPHSVEIETDGQPVAYQLAEGLDLVIETLNPDDAVEFEYVEQPIEGDDSIVQRIIMHIARANADGGTGESGKLPGTKTITVEVEGMQEDREATAAVGNGYTIYVFEQFTFDAAANRLTMNVDHDYYVDIAKLPAYDDAAQRAEAEAWLKDMGTIEEHEGDEITAPLRGASLYMTAAADALTRTYVVKEIDGSYYAFKINKPHREPSEGFGPLVYASINSIVTSK